MSGAETVTRELSPYRGLRRYTWRDSRLFFGRDGDVDELLAITGINPVSALYARSGAGKSSMLRALFAPRLEAKGVTPVVVQPRGQVGGQVSRIVFEAFRSSLLATLFPSPALEREAVGRLIDCLGDGARELTFARARDAYLAIPVSDEKSAEVLGAGEDAPSPVFSRCLLMPVWRSRLNRALALLHLLEPSFSPVGFDPVVSCARDAARQADRLIGEITLGALEVALAGDVDVAHATFVRLLSEKADTPVALVNAVATDERFRDLKFSFLLIADQFEEMFTLWTGAERKEALQAYAAFLAKSDPRVSTALLLSLREDFVASLDETQSAFGPIQVRQRYNLPLLPSGGFDAAVTEPAKAFGFGFSEDALATIRNTLRLKEDVERFEPAKLQIVCSYLWRTDVLGKSIKKITDETISSHRDKADSGISFILNQHFALVLQKIEPDQAKFDALAMLNLLKRSEGKRHVRNVVSKASLTGLKFRQREKLEEVLEILRVESLVGFETTRSDILVEITHEFALGSVARFMEDLTADEVLGGIWKSLDRVFWHLERRMTPRFGDISPLADWDMHALHWFRDRLDKTAVKGRIGEQVLVELVKSNRSVHVDERNEILLWWGGTLAGTSADLTGETLEYIIDSGERLPPTALDSVRALLRESGTLGEQFYRCSFEAP